MNDQPCLFLSHAGIEINTLESGFTQSPVCISWRHIIKKLNESISCVSE